VEAGVNPKDTLGVKRVPMGLIPPVAKVYAALAHLDGAEKYGPYNWRNPDAKVRASIYVDAVYRHLDAFVDGEWLAPDSGIPHLAHAVANCNILMDAFALDHVVDDRPRPGPYRQSIVEAEWVITKLMARDSRKKK